MSNPEKQSISEKITSLDEKVKWFYSDEFRLDSAAKNYEEAAKLAKEIEADLESLKNEIKVLSRDFTS